MLYFFKIYVWFFNTYDYVYCLDGIYEKNKYIQNQLRLFMHSLKYNIYIIEIIHHTLDVIYISIEYIIFMYLYMYIISVCILNIAPCYLYYIPDSVSMRVLCPYLGSTPIKKISHPNITSDI